jgi:FG-GAP-like repeat/FG-GAP repeat
MALIKNLALTSLLFVAASANAQTYAPNRAGFPLLIAGGGVARISKPLVVDLDSLDNSGPKEIVVGTSSGKLYVIQANGTVRAGWPQTLPAEIASSPAAGNLDGDGDLEIVVGCGSPNPPSPSNNAQGRVVAFRPDGTTLWSFTALQDVVEGPDGFPDPVYASPAIGDLDGDGDDDVAFASWDHRVYAVRGGDGALLPGWPYDVRDTIWASPALADLDGDGAMEIIVGADSHLEGPPIDTKTGGAIWVFRRNGSLFPGFPRFVEYPGPPAVGIHSSPAVGDIDGDNCPDIVVGTGSPANQSTGKQMHAWRSDGSILPNWPITLDGHPGNSPILVNLDGDPALEVVISDDASPPNLYAFNGNGGQIFKMTPKSSTGATAVVIGEAVAAQIGANDPTILLSGVGFDVTLISKTGVQLSEDGFPYLTITYAGDHPIPGAAVADLDNDGGLEIVAPSAKLDETALRIDVWSAGSIGALPWAHFHRDSKRTGNASASGCPRQPPSLDFFTVPPCRISDSRLAANLTYGGPKLQSGEQRTITFTTNPPRCLIPAGAKAVALNITVTEGTASGVLRVFPGGDGLPTASTMNWSSGQTRANNQVLPLSFEGRGHLTVYVDMPPANQVHVIIDVTGYFL